MIQNDVFEAAIANAAGGSKVLCRVNTKNRVKDFFDYLDSHILREEFKIKGNNAKSRVGGSIKICTFLGYDINRVDGYDLYVEEADVRQNLAQKLADLVKNPPNNAIDAMFRDMRVKSMKRKI